MRVYNLLSAWEQYTRPSVSLSQRIRLGPWVSQESWEVTGQMLLLDSQFPEVTLCSFNCHWLAKDPADSLRTALCCVSERAHAALNGHHSVLFPSLPPKATKLICCSDGGFENMDTLCLGLLRTLGHQEKADLWYVHKRCGEWSNNAIDYTPSFLIRLPARLI